WATVHDRSRCVAFEHDPVRLIFAEREPNCGSPWRDGSDVPADVVEPARSPSSDDPGEHRSAVVEGADWPRLEAGAVTEFEDALRFVDIDDQVADVRPPFLVSRREVDAKQVVSDMLWCRDRAVRRDPRLLILSRENAAELLPFHALTSWPVVV